MEKPIIYVARSGLSNRLRSLVGFMAIAELTNSPLFIHWIKQGACNVGLTELYDLSKHKNVYIIGHEEAECMKNLHPESYYSYTEPFTDLYNKDICPVDYNSYCHRATRLLRELTPVTPLKSIIDEFSKTNKLADCIGIHIRMTDNTHCYKTWAESDPHFDANKISQLDGFLEQIANANKNNIPIFLATDNEDISKLLIKEFNNIIEFQKEYNTKNLTDPSKSSAKGYTANILSKFLKKQENKPLSLRTTSIQDALIDLYLLSKCKKVIGTYYSSFSQISALIGGIPCEIIEDKTPVCDNFSQSLNELYILKKQCINHS